MSQKSHIGTTKRDSKSRNQSRDGSKGKKHKANNGEVQRKPKDIEVDTLNQMNSMFLSQTEEGQTNLFTNLVAVTVYHAIKPSANGQPPTPEKIEAVESIVKGISMLLPAGIPTQVLAHWAYYKRLKTKKPHNVNLRSRKDKSYMEDTQGSPLGPEVEYTVNAPVGYTEQPDDVEATELSKIQNSITLNQSFDDFVQNYNESDFGLGENVLEGYETDYFSENEL